MTMLPFANHIADENIFASCSVFTDSGYKVDWIGGRSKYAQLWIGLDWIGLDWIGSLSCWNGLDWILQNGAMSNCRPC